MSLEPCLSFSTPRRIRVSAESPTPGALPPRPRGPEQTPALSCPVSPSHMRLDRVGKDPSSPVEGKLEEKDFPSELQPHRDTD